MKISSQQSTAELEAYLKATSKDLSKTSRDQGAGRGSSAASADNVSLSSKAKELQEASSALKALPDTREAKVSEIKARVDSGTYNVKGEEVAASIVRSSILDALL